MDGAGTAAAALCVRELGAGTVAVVAAAVLWWAMSASYGWPVAAAAAGCGRELSVALGLLLLRSADGLCVQAVADVRLLLLGGVKTL